ELDRLCKHILLLENGILQPETIDLNEEKSAIRYMTLQMETCPAREVIAEFQALEGVLQVTNPQKNEFIVAYDPERQPHMDLQLMQCITSQHWQYRQLSHGKTLEEKLFFKD
ncbi:ABC transporter ATP-binding protein, partial [bacterium]|nr:ABC transporter ATP-binding protein [bacterium]